MLKDIYQLPGRAHAVCMVVIEKLPKKEEPSILFLLHANSVCLANISFKDNTRRRI
jgi:hypothetical protein